MSTRYFSFSSPTTFIDLSVVMVYTGDWLLLFFSDDVSNCLMPQAASELIRSTVEPMLEQYRPAVLASLTLSKLTLGTVAPQFTGSCFQI